MMSAQEGSLNCTRFQSPIMVANIKPTGQMRQNTGKPNTAAEASVPHQHRVAAVQPHAVALATNRRERLRTRRCARAGRTRGGRAGGLFFPRIQQFAPRQQPTAPPGRKSHRSRCEKPERHAPPRPSSGRRALRRLSPRYAFSGGRTSAATEQGTSRRRMPCLPGQSTPRPTQTAIADAA